MSASAAPILVFDSGVGGLSVLGPIAERLPRARMVYVADNGGFPYGTKSEMEVATRVCALLGRLTERYRPRIIVIACNTASTIALAHVRAALAVPAVGTVPAIKPAAEATRSKVIGVLGTVATVRQPYVDRLAAEFAKDCVVLRHGSAELVEAAEAELRGRGAPLSVYADALAGLVDQPGGERMDTVVLACTHFPLVKERLAMATCQPICFVDGAEGIARRTAYLLDGATWGEPAPGRAVFTSQSGDVDALRPALARFGLTEVEHL
jgi:glutamate racemase